MFRNLRNSGREITGVVRTYNRLCSKIQNCDLVGVRGGPTSPTEGSSKNYITTSAKKERSQMGALGRTELHSLMPVKTVVLSRGTKNYL